MALDYIVIGKRTDKNDVITHLKTSRVTNNQAQTPSAKTKDEVISDMSENGSTYYTAKKEEGDFITRKKIQVVTQSGECYLRIDSNDKSTDFLPEIPKF